MLATTFLTTAMAITPAQTNYEIVDVETTTPAPFLEREDITISFGDASFEQITVTHLHTKDFIPSPFPTIWVGPLGIGTRWYEQTFDDYKKSFAARLAYKGHDVWLVPLRAGDENTLPAGSCADPNNPTVPPLVDCSAFGQWGLADVVEDVEFTRTLIEGEKNPTIGGIWTGAMASMAVVNAHPENYAGAIFWEGSLYAEDPFVLGKNSAICASLDGLPDMFAADPTPQIEQTVIDLAVADPEGLSPFPQQALDPYFLTAGEATNIQVAWAIFIVDNFKGLLDRVVPGLVFMTGDLENGPAISDFNQLINVAQSGPRQTYGSLGILRDFACGLGGDPEHTADLHNFTKNVYFIGGDKGLEDEMVVTEALFTDAANVYTDYRDDRGAYDLYLGPERQEFDFGIFLFNYFSQL